MTEVMSMQMVKGKGQGHRGQTQFSNFRTVTPVCIDINKVVCQISRSHISKKSSIWPKLGVSGL